MLLFLFNTLLPEMDRDESPDIFVAKVILQAGECAAGD
jgi:hypothetical protein